MEEITSIFDTNGYREFYEIYLKNKTAEERSMVIQKLRLCERKINISPALNLFVLAELLKHFSSTADPGYQICKEALKLTFEHCKKGDRLNFIPPPELEVCSELFGKLPKAFDDFLGRLGYLYMELMKDTSEETLNKYRAAFVEIAQWIDDYKQSFVESYSKYLNSEDPLNSSIWHLHPDDKEKRKKLIAHLKKEDRRLELAIGLIFFIGKHLDFQVELTEKQLLEMAETLRKNRSLGFELMMRIITMFFNRGGYNLSTGNRPNDVIDFLFALSLDVSKKRILVTGDKDMHRYAGEIGQRDKIMSLDEYLKFIGFID